MPDITSEERDKELTRRIITYGTDELDLGPRKTEASGLLVQLGLPWPEGMAPQPKELGIEPNPSDPMPEADVLVITWTVAEVEALADTLTPGFGRENWYRYDRNYKTHYESLIRGRAPARNAQRLASYFPTIISGKRVLCVKSELHLNQDGIKTGDGTATLPVKDFFKQIIAEVKPKLVITVGTAGGVYPDHELGDVMITRAAKFRLAKEFKNENFNHALYKSNFIIPKARLGDAKDLLKIHKDMLTEPPLGPPSKKYKWSGGLIKGPTNNPDLKIDGTDFPEFHPILTTDYFEFGTSTNGLEMIGCGVEMGDAVLGLVCEEMGASAPDWLVIRNASDPQINGDLPAKWAKHPSGTNMQAHWAVWYYETYGYWTSVNSAIATWAMIA